MGGGVLRVLFQDLVGDLDRLVELPPGEVEIGQALFDHGQLGVGLEHLPADGDRLVPVADPGVEVGEEDAVAGHVRVLLMQALEDVLSLVRVVVQDGKVGVGEVHVFRAGVDLQRGTVLPVRVFHPARHEVIVGQRQPGLDRARIPIRRFPETSLDLLRFPALLLRDLDGYEGGEYLGLEPEPAQQLPDRLVQVDLSRHGVGEQDVPRDARGILLDDEFGLGPGFVEFALHEQEIPPGQLGVEVVGVDFSRRQDRLPPLLRPAHGEIGPAEFIVGGREAGVLLQGVAEFEHRLAVFPLGEIFLPPLEVLFRAPGASRGQQ